MENNRGRDERSEQNSFENDAKQPIRNNFPQQFEGMNFEQQRGSYKNSDKGGAALERETNEDLDSWERR